MTKELYEECVSLLNCWFEEQEFAEQGAFARARWAVKKLAVDLGLHVIERDLHGNDPVKVSSSGD